MEWGKLLLGLSRCLGIPFRQMCPKVCTRRAWDGGGRGQECIFWYTLASNSFSFFSSYAGYPVGSRKASVKFRPKDTLNLLPKYFF